MIKNSSSDGSIIVQKKEEQRESSAKSLVAVRGEQVSRIVRSKSSVNELESEPMKKEKVFVKQEASQSVARVKNELDVVADMKLEKIEERKTEICERDKKKKERPSRAENVQDSAEIQEKIIEIAKNTLMPFYMSKHVTKEEYKFVLKKVVGKVNFKLF